MVHDWTLRPDVIRVGSEDEVVVVCENSEGECYVVKFISDSFENRFVQKYKETRCVCEAQKRVWTNDGASMYIETFMEDILGITFPFDSYA
tara:strand:+ start:1654 stop:1926 length:273 start_codon:yes stop_codon:yes gene_type:complete